MRDAIVDAALRAGRPATLDTHELTDAERLALRDAKPGGVVLESTPLWRFNPYNPGDAASMGLVLEVEGDADEASARVAHEIFGERKRQRSGEGYSAADDDGYGNGELQRAAAAYSFAAALKPSDAAWLITDRKVPRPVTAYHILDTVRTLWPWRQEAFKPDIARRMLVKAGALILAAIEAIDRKAARDAAQWKDADNG